MLKDFLFGKNHISYSKESLLKENLNRTKYFAVIIFILEACFLFMSFIMPSIINENLLSVYRMHYLVLLLTSGLFYHLVKFYIKKDHYSLRIEILLYFALFFAVGWGASISLLDIGDQLGITVYLTFLFMSSFAILSRPDISLGILMVIQVIFCASIPDVGSRLSIQINSSVFVLFAWFVGRYQYILINERYLKDKIIEEKNKMLENQNQELARLMMTDHLTGIYNRYSLDDILAKKWMESYIHHEPLTCLMIDIDDFKKFNDRFGHIHGDRCIKEVSIILKEICDKEKGYAFRYGGDEFCLVFTGVVHPEQIISEIQFRVDQLNMEIEEEIVPLKLTVGMYHQVPEKSDEEWVCIEKADADLYKEKSKRNRRSTDELA